MQSAPSNNSLPSPKSSSTDWKQIILLSVVLVYYLLQSFSSLAVDGPLGKSIGVDFRAFWSAGYIANNQGYAEVYDLEQMGAVQGEIIPPSGSAPLPVVPVPYLPIFVVIFQVFALLPPIPAFSVWSALNGIGLVLYLVFIFRNLKIQSWSAFIFPGVLAFPVFFNLYSGQINLLLLICVGEFLRNILLQKDLQAGLWLGGLVLKPQLLILILPVLLLQKKWKLLGGSFLSILVAVIISLVLAKPSGLAAMVTLILKYSAGLPTNIPENMMNWRMIGERLSWFLPPTYAWVVAAVGMTCTATIVFLLWRKPLATDSAEFLAAFTGTLAATLAITWHSHVHMAMILLLPVFYLHARQKLGQKIVHWWLFSVPIITLFISFPLRLLFADTYDLMHGLQGSIMLVFNLVFIGWAWKFIRSRTSRSTNA